MNPTRNILRSAIRKEDDKLNIVSFLFDGYFDNFLAKTGHNFYTNLNTAPFGWDTKLVDIPHNVLLSKTDGIDIPLSLDIDLVLFSDGIHQYDIASRLAHMSHVPLLYVEHINPKEIYGDQDFAMLKASRKFTKHIVTAKTIKKAWQTDCIFLSYGVDTDYFSPLEKDDSVLIVGQFRQQDYTILGALMQTIPNLHIIGNNPGISSNDISKDDLCNLYRKASIFINISNTPQLQISLLRGLSSGCAVVSNNSPIVKDSIPESCAMFCSSITEIVSSVKKILSVKSVANELSSNARKLAIENFNEKNLLPQWNNVLRDTSSITYVR